MFLDFMGNTYAQFAQDLLHTQGAYYVPYPFTYLTGTSNHTNGRRAGFFENEHLPVVFWTLCFKNEITNKKKTLLFYQIHIAKKIKVFYCYFSW